MNRLDWSTLDTAAQRAALLRPVQEVAAATRDAVAALLKDVRERGDTALREITARFDKTSLAGFEVSEEEFAAAEEEIGEDLKEAMRQALQRIETFHRAGMAMPYAVETAPGVVCERVIRPIRRVGLYVPAGTAPLPSTALMLGVPARLAGCEEVVLCTPPRKDGSADPSVLVAARLTGVSRVLKLGGAQGIAAMAYGTGSIRKCDKIFGPGNSYVTEAKQQVAREGAVAIDMPAGPSEVLVIADAGANPAFVAADLLSQAEHGPDSQVLLLSEHEELLSAVERQIEMQLAALPRAAIAREALSSSRLIKVESLPQAFDISNEYAPEHLILALREPRDWLGNVKAAGSVFLGDFTPEALGDYCSGTNHVLPTSGAAKAYSGVSVSSFQKFVSVQAASRSGIAGIGDCAVTLARAEGLDAHANAVVLRMQGGDGMSGVLDLVREDLRDFAGYKSARSEILQGDVWLNANESAWANPADLGASSRRYPDAQPAGLRSALVDLYACEESKLLIGRGSDEAIDLLVRALCNPGRDAVLVTPPVFGMYAVCARLQNAPLVEVPLRDGPEGFGIDPTAIAEAAIVSNAKLVFLCSPANPTGGAIALADIGQLASALEGRSLVVVDEAYGEFSDFPSATTLQVSQPNIAVLRTLSKAHALAAARIGVVIADAGLIDVLRRCQAPYPVPTPCAELALAGLSPQALVETRRRVALVRSERNRLQAALAVLPEVLRVYPSQGNYLLARFRDAEAAFQALLSAGVVVRDQRAAPQLGDALRITIGSPEQNDRVISALRLQEAAA